MAKKGSKKRGARTAAKSGGGLEAVSTAELRQEIARRHKMIDKLRGRREALLRQIAEVDASLAEFGMVGGAAIPAGGKRARNTETLADALARVLKNATMSVTEAAAAVQAAGYQTTAANFRTIVNQTLIKDDRFQNVARGQYTAK